MEGFRRTESWTSSEASFSESLTRTMSPGPFAQQRQHQVRAGFFDDRIYIYGRTDEKHNLYLKSMEASFVDQLYDSMDFLRCKSRKERFPGSTHCTLRARFQTDVFAFLRGGCWKKVNFERPGFRPKKRDSSMLFHGRSLDPTL
ncbi:hypothetical protein GQ457_01G010350 [Hibiscus cannabinus]